MSNLTIVKGDATSPLGEGLKVIPHVCNDIGAWGAGFVMALSKKWPEPEQRYREWYRTGISRGKPFQLGEVQNVKVESNIVVSNMIGQYQTGYGAPYPNDEGTLRAPVRYGAIAKCMSTLAETMPKDASIHMPQFGCGLAGGQWPIILDLVLEYWIDKGIDVTVYVFP